MKQQLNARSTEGNAYIIIVIIIIIINIIVWCNIQTHVFHIRYIPRIAMLQI